jgi:hypothetical protein
MTPEEKLKALKSIELEKFEQKRNNDPKHTKKYADKKKVRSKNKAASKARARNRK